MTRPLPQMPAVGGRDDNDEEETDNELWGHKSRVGKINRLSLYIHTSSYNRQQTSVAAPERKTWVKTWIRQIGVDSRLSADDAWNDANNRCRWREQRPPPVMSAN